MSRFLVLGSYLLQVLIVFHSCPDRSVLSTLNMSLRCVVSAVMHAKCQTPRGIRSCDIDNLVARDAINQAKATFLKSNKGYVRGENAINIELWLSADFPVLHHCSTNWAVCSGHRGARLTRQQEYDMQDN
jgi:hypothetical protein